MAASSGPNAVRGYHRAGAATRHAAIRQAAWPARRRASRDESFDRNFLGARGGLDAGGGEQRQGIAPERFQALTQHLAPLAEGGLGHLLQRDGFAGQRRAARNQLDQRRRDFGRRHERGRRDVEQDARLGAPAGQHRQAAVRLRARRRGDAFRDLALEHQHQPVEPGRPRLGGQPADQERGRDVVGQVGDDARRSRLRAAFCGSKASASAATTSRRPG